MIFRRFLQRFKQQQWGAITTELVIVIVGVFIGMQVSNSNESRKERSRKFACQGYIADNVPNSIQLASLFAIPAHFKLVIPANTRLLRQDVGAIIRIANGPRVVLQEQRVIQFLN